MKKYNLNLFKIGIKPCVSAFGGNQFDASQTRYIETFFSIFYLSINIGSTVATLITPILRSDVKCFGQGCYPLAFGVPAAFMFVAIIFFIAGNSYYKKEAAKNNGNIIVKTVQCIYVAIRNKFSNKSQVKKHWLDYADNRFDSKLISSVKAFCKVLVVYIPCIIFWALYDQQGKKKFNST
jgi:dipeptide/tripeptide permease